MNDILTQPDEDNLAGPATQQDLMHLSEALAGLDTGLGEAPLPTTSAGIYDLSPSLSTHSLRPFHLSLSISLSSLPITYYL